MNTETHNQTCCSGIALGSVVKELVNVLKAYITNSGDGMVRNASCARMAGFKMKFTGGGGKSKNKSEKSTSLHFESFLTY